jgi:serine phosphatase RsbU (regulator of sigma subunit)
MTTRGEYGPGIMNVADLEIAPNQSLRQTEIDINDLRLGELIGFTDFFADTTPAELIHQTFLDNPKLPAVLILQHQQLRGAISRNTFFQMLSQKNGLAIYHPRPISLMLEHSKVKTLVLPTHCRVSEAVSRCLERPSDHVYEPLIVEDRSGYKIIDFHTLIIAQSQLLHKATQRSERQQSMLKRKNREILDSIFYAQRIQKSMLRDPGCLDKWGLEVFLIFKPRDIVSGDFFYVTEFQERIFIAAVDCTGHGVPGAFMALIGHNLLDDIVTARRIREPNQILTCLNDSVRRSLNQSSEGNSGRDGMDVCLCVIDPHQNKLYFSGAKRPLYITTGEGEPLVFKGDHSSVGGIQRETSRTYSIREVPLQPGQTFYLTTDGYADQNAPDNEKFGTTRLKQIFQEIQKLPLKEKKQRLETVLLQHQSGQVQRDDITLIGVEWHGI